MIYYRRKKINFSKTKQKIDSTFGAVNLEFSFFTIKPLNETAITPDPKMNYFIHIIKFHFEVVRDVKMLKVTIVIQQ